MLKLKNLFEEDEDSDSGNGEDDDSGDESESIKGNNTKNAGGESSGRVKEKQSARASSKSQRVPHVEVEIDLGLSAFANACQLYGQRKTAKTKEIKTVEQSVRAIQAVLSSDHT